MSEEKKNDKEEGISQNKIRCKAIIEVLGKPQTYVEESIKKYVEHIKQDSELIVLNEYNSEIKDQGKLWTKFVELELLFKDSKKLISFCFEYMPSSIEVIKPDQMSFSSTELSNLINDLQARLHNVDMVVKKMKAENDFLKVNMNNIIQNSIIITLRLGNLSLDQLSQVTGIHKKELELYLEKLIEEKKIKKDGELYSLL